MHIDTQIKSPITGGATVKVNEIPISLVVKNNKKQYGIDVEAYLGRLSAISILKCVDTGYCFYPPFPKIDEERMYNKIGRQGKYYPKNRWEFPIALHLISPTDKTLEIGCGYGYFLDMLTAEKHFAEGIELNKNAIAVNAQKGNKVINKPIQDLAETHKSEYDTVCMFQVLEHIENVDSFFKSVLSVCRQGGKIIISVPNNDAFVTRFAYLHGAGNIPPHHIGLWTKDALVNLGKHYNLKVVYVEEQRLPRQLAGHYYTLKMMRYFGKLAAPLTLCTRWLAKMILKKKANSILGPTILVVFEK
jgi:2-polyprenyl-3-methyl-5-hydroxy-6-metoxy-1,4-benzoquinol methylase